MLLVCVDKTYHEGRIYWIPEEVHRKSPVHAGRIIDFLLEKQHQRFATIDSGDFVDLMKMT
jgi:hypothetical protein